jgi:type I site-specific restriction-modification system R (restriction) subunit
MLGYLRRLPLLSPVPEHVLRPVLRDNHVLRAESQRDLSRTGQQRRAVQIRHLHEACPDKGQTTKAYEDEAKRRFIEEPANLKLLIVVSKLLTGFDAPSCTYSRGPATAP